MAPKAFSERHAEMERPEAPPLLAREAGMPRKRSRRAGKTDGAPGAENQEPGGRSVGCLKSEGREVRMRIFAASWLARRRFFLRHDRAGAAREPKANGLPRRDPVIHLARQQAAKPYGLPGQARQ